MTPRPLPTLFTRIVARPYERCRTSVCATFPGAVALPGGDGIRLIVHLPVARRRSVPMRLEISPWATDGTVTALELVPARAVRATSRYFRAGHRLLDDIVAGLLGPPLEEVPVRTERRSVHSAA